VVSLSQSSGRRLRPGMSSRSPAVAAALASPSMDAVAVTTGEVTPELVMELLRPSEVALSSDGSRIAFGVSATFREQGKLIETRLWTGDVDGELRPGEAGTLPRFSPDGSAGSVG
jgi:hypothetical protein